MFKLIKIDNARMNVPEPEYYECGETLACGQVVYLTMGKLRKVDDNDAKEFVAMADGVAGETIPVCRLCKEQVWETRIENSESGWGLSKIGETVNVTSTEINPYTDIPSKDADAVVVEKGEPDTFESNGAPSGGYVRIRFLCNYGKDASSGKNS
jgi:hypothetical protein